MAEGKEILNKLKTLKNNSDSIKIKTTKGRVSGALIGAGGGLLIGFTRGYNLLSSAFVGALIGGVVSYLLLPKDEDED